VKTTSFHRRKSAKATISNIAAETASGWWGLPMKWLPGGISSDLTLCRPDVTMIFTAAIAW